MEGSAGGDFLWAAVEGGGRFVDHIGRMAEFGSGGGFERIFGRGEGSFQLGDGVCRRLQSAVLTSEGGGGECSLEVGGFVVRYRSRRCFFRDGPGKMDTRTRGADFDSVFDLVGELKFVQTVETTRHSRSVGYFADGDIASAFPLGEANEGGGATDEGGERNHNANGDEERVCHEDTGKENE